MCSNPLYLQSVNVNEWMCEWVYQFVQYILKTKNCEAAERIAVGYILENNEERRPQMNGGEDIVAKNSGDVIKFKVDTRISNFFTKFVL